MAFCLECGTQLPDRAKFCSNCGLQLTAQRPVKWDEPVTPPASAPPEAFEPPAYRNAPRAVAPPEPYSPPEMEPDPRPPYAGSELSDESAFATTDVRDEPSYAPSEYRDEPQYPTAEFPVERRYSLRDDPPEPLSSYRTSDLPPEPSHGPPEDPDDRPFALSDLPPFPPEQKEMRSISPEPYKASRGSWFARNKLVTALLVVIVLVVVAALVNSRGNTPTGGQTAFPSAPSTVSGGVAPTDQAQASGSTLFPGRSGAAPGDQERNLGESATIEGVDATVVAASFQQSVSDTEKDGYVVADVSYTTTSTDSKPYAQSDWKLQKPDGSAIDVQPVSAPGQLQPGNAVAGPPSTGKLTFKVGAEKGDFFIIWKPSPFASSGVWKVTVS